jgi:Rhodopirellula transposase DDE domain
MTIAGLPQDKDVKWTHLSERTIGDSLAAKNHIISRYHIKQMLKFRQYKKRSLLKKIALKDVEGRNEQFEKIATYRKSFTDEGLPVISIDTKKKELLGNFSRPGTAYSTAERLTNDHDFQSSAQGQVVPHGIYDVNENIGYVTLGLSKDTSEFVCDNLSKCWTETLQYKYPDAETMLLLCDGGGSNASAHYIVKQDLVKLAKILKINILVAHYPPYCSKWNPIEHRLFSQITHTWSGVALKNIEYVKNLTNTTTTRTGLKVITSINSKQYFNKREVSQKFRDNIENYVTFDDKRPKWNYLIKGRD